MNLADFMAGLARTSVEASVLILLVLAAQRIFRRQLTPAWSCALWLLVAARLAALSWSGPVSVFNVVPLLRSSTPEAFVLAARRAPIAAPLASQVAESPLSGRVATSAAVSATRAAPVVDPTSPWVSTSGALFTGWAVGASALALYVAIASLQLARRLARLPALADPAVHEILAAGCARLKLRRLPRVSETDEVSAPALHGFFRPHLLLPRGLAGRLSTEELRFVLLHELAHVRRADLALNWLAAALQAIHWFNPLVWLALARWRDDREIACDALVLSSSDASRRRAYGHTLLRLGETLAVRAPRPGLVGILEGKRALQRRIGLIAQPTTARRPLTGVLIFSTLALVGLTGAQPAAPLAPLAPLEPVSGLELANVAVGKNVLFLVDAGESMLGKDPAEVARWRSESPDRQRRAPKWQRTAEVLATLLAQLPADARYRVVRFDDRNVTELETPRPGQGGTPQAIASVARRLQEMTPRSAGMNLEAAFTSSLSPSDLPDRIVLITDGLPTVGRTTPPGTGDVEVKLFEAAVRLLPSRVPVSTVLLPRAGAHVATTGLYWELAHASRGALVTASAPALPATHLAFVIDTSGSMRDVRNGGLWPVARRTIRDSLAAQPAGTRFQLLDADGRFILGRAGMGANAWLDNTPEMRDQVERMLGRYNQDTVSNPVPGIYNAIRFLHARYDPAMRMGIVVVGDEFVDAPEPVIRRLDELNPANASGQRAIMINAIGVPTTIRQQFSMGNTGLKFASLMRSITQEHGGTFVALPDL